MLDKNEGEIVVMGILTVIFEQLETTEEWKQICKRVDAEITKILYEGMKESSESECERIRDAMFAVIQDAEKQAFVQGFTCALKLWRECTED